MEQTYNEQINSAAQPAAAEQEKGASAEEISLGKFENVSELLKAYNSLQAEFTRRCQRIKELEGAASKGQDNPPSQSAGTFADGAKGISDEQKNTIIGDYLKSLMSAKQSAVIIGDSGISVKTPVSRPKTIREAGNLAKEKLSKKL